MRGARRSTQYKKKFDLSPLRGSTIARNKKGG